MFFSNDEDDQDFLTPSSGSKLASLFGMDQAISQGGNESLKYKAPTEPKKGKSDDSKNKAGSPSILHAEAAQVYKYTDGKYASLGKLGVAVLANHTSLDYKVLLYKSKQDQVTYAQITEQFNFTIQANNYVSFYDETRQNWSLNFPTENSLAQFAKQVTLAKAYSVSGQVETTLSQDLTLGSGGTLESGDSVEIKYTGWLYKDGGLGEVFDSTESTDKPFRFKLGKGKVIKGWEDGVLGMRKNGRRLLVIPADQAYGAKGHGNKVPPNATLVFDIEVLRVKLAKEKEAENPEEPHNTSIDNEKEDDASSVKSRSKSISDQMSQCSDMEEVPGKTGKAKLISRMAKMGKPMLPMAGAVPANPESDYDDEETVPSSPASVESKPQLPRKPMSHSTAHNTAPPVMNSHHTPHPDQHAHIGMPTDPQVYPGVSHQIQTSQPFAPQYPQTVMPGVQPPSVFQGVSMPAQLAVYQPPIQQQMMQGQYAPYQAPQPVPPVQATTQSSSNSSSSELPVMLSEHRQQNTEMRISLTKITDKMDRLTEKIDYMQQHGAGAMVQAGSLPSMEPSLLLQNITRIIHENERLKKELFEKTTKIESQNEKISDLLQRNQKFVEKSNELLEQRNEDFKYNATQAQSKVLSLEQEKVQMARELSSATSQLGSVQMELNTAQRSEMELRKQLDDVLSSSSSHKDDLTKHRAINADLENRLETAIAALKDEKLIRKQLDSKVEELEDRLSEANSQSALVEKTMAEKKKKAVDDKKKIEEEFEEMKNQYEKEISSLKAKLKEQRSSTDLATSEKVSQIEADLNEEWQQKLDRQLKAQESKHKRAIQDLQEEKSAADEKIAQFNTKLSKASTQYASTDKELLELQNQVEELKVWKTKYDNLRSQAKTMRDKYEARLAEVEESRDEMEEQKDAAEDRMRQAVEKARQTMSQAKALAAQSSSGAAPDQSSDVTAEVKKVMNSVYQELKQEFEPEKKYKGNDVQKTIMGTIKNVTIQMMNAQKAEEESSDDDEEEEDEDDDEEEGELQGEDEESEGEVKQEVTKLNVEKDDDNKTEAVVKEENLEEKPTYINKEKQANNVISNDAENEAQVIDNHTSETYASPNIIINETEEVHHGSDKDDPSVEQPVESSGLSALDNEQCLNRNDNQSSSSHEVESTVDKTDMNEVKLSTGATQNVGEENRDETHGTESNKDSDSSWEHVDPASTQESTKEPGSSDSTHVQTESTHDPKESIDKPIESAPILTSHVSKLTESKDQTSPDQTLPVEENLDGALVESDSVDQEDASHDKEADLSSSETDSMFHSSGEYEDAVEFDVAGNKSSPKKDEGKDKAGDSNKKDVNDPLKSLISTPKEDSSAKKSDNKKSSNEKTDSQSKDSVESGAASAKSSKNPPPIKEPNGSKVKSSFPLDDDDEDDLFGSSSLNKPKSKKPAEKKPKAEDTKPKSLFGDDDDENDDDADLFFSKPSSSLKPPAKDKRISSDDELKPKPPPMPLFGDDEDDDDDWLK